MMKRLASIAVCTAFGIAPFAASAANMDMDLKGYIGGGLGYAQIEGEEIFEDFDVDLEDDRMTWQLYGGMTFTPYIGLEANYVDFDEASESGAVFASDGFGLALAGHLPVTEYFSLSARVGQFWWNADASFDGTDIDFDDSGNDTYYGLDARFGRPGGALGVAVKYDRYDVGAADISMPSVNLELGF